MRFLPDTLPFAISVFILSTVVILFAGVKITRLADTLGKRTGMGSALFGALLLGGTTSLPGIVTSVSTAWQGYAALSTSNAVGGIAAQTIFLIFADMIYRKTNLEHAAASLENLVQSTLLIALLCLPMVAMNVPNWTFFSIHPVSILMLLTYGFGIRLVNDAKEQPNWFPSTTSDTKSESDVPVLKKPLKTLWLMFAFFGSLVAMAGLTIAESGIYLAQKTGISETVVGTLLTSVATSLPELVTVLFAVRMGALNLAVGDIIGGNSFDVLFLSFSDFAYRDGSIYHAAGQSFGFLVGINILMTATLLLGLLRRKRRAIGNIGFEGIVVLLLYSFAVFVIAA